MMINAHAKITLHFSLATADGLQIDSTFDKQAATFVMGDGSLLPGFESKLIGLKGGDEKTFLLFAHEAFGEINPGSIHVMDKKQFKNIDLSGNELSEGLVISFDGAGKQPMPGVVKKIDGDQVTVDFNHPLAGQAIRFSVKIIAIEQVAPVKINVRST